MRAGRELDSLIATKVMGLTVQKDQVTRGLFADKKPDDPFDYFIGTTNDRIPNYSTDIKDAWEVVEKLKCDNFIVLYLNQSWAAGVSGVRFGYGDTAAHAICNYALEVT